MPLATRNWGARQLGLRGRGCAVWVAGTLVFGVCTGLLAEGDSATGVRAQFAAYAQTNYQSAQARYQAEPRNVEAGWQFGRACFDLADSASDRGRRAELAERGIEACRQAVSLDPNSAPAHYYLGMNLGQLAQTKGLGALRLIKEMKGEFGTARQMDERLDYGGPDRNLGLLYRDAPSLVSGGNRSDAKRHLQRAVELAPEYPENRLDLVEAYVKWGEDAAAQRELQALEEIWPKARAKFVGLAWTSSWADWERQLNKLKQAIEAPRKPLTSPRDQG